MSQTALATSVLGEDLLAEIVDHRARGLSWEATARAVEWDVFDLRRALRHEPAYSAALERAQREVEQEADADGLQRLRVLLGDDNTAIARDATQIIMKYLSEKRRDETRLAVERLRTEAKLATAASRRAKGEANQAEPSGPRRTPEQDRQIQEIAARHEREHAERVIRDNTTVFLWGGCHAIGNTPPDDTDTPLYLFCDKTVTGRSIFWVVTNPPPTHVTDGPFLKPPGQPVWPR